MELEDHAVIWPAEPCSRRRFPESVNTSLPELSLRGRSRLATQLMASGDTENQMPRYLLVDTPGEKKPRVNVPPTETSVSPSVRRRPLPSLVAPPEAKAALGASMSRSSSDKSRSRGLQARSMIMLTSLLSAPAN